MVLFSTLCKNVCRVHIEHSLWEGGHRFYLISLYMRMPVGKWKLSIALTTRKSLVLAQNTRKQLVSDCLQGADKIKRGLSCSIENNCCRSSWSSHTWTSRPTPMYNSKEIENNDQSVPSTNWFTLKKVLQVWPQRDGVEVMEGRNYRNRE